MRRLAALLLSGALLATGIFGAFAYAHNYYLYRGFGPPRNPAGVAAGSLKTVHFYSRALHSNRSYAIYLPPGFSAARAHSIRYPVLYLLHGSPGSPDLFVNAGAVGVALDTLIAHHRVKPFIIVLPAANTGFGSANAWANTARGGYESFVIDTVRAVDQQWPTMADGAHRAIAGLSDGGFGATNIALHNLTTFGTFESWSGYFAQNARGPFRGASPAQIHANSPARYIRSISAQVRAARLHAFIYGGGHDRGSAAIPPFAAQLRGAGAQVSTASYPGGHTWRLWRTHMPVSLRYAAMHIGA